MFKYKLKKLDSDELQYLVGQQSFREQLELGALPRIIRQEKKQKGKDTAPKKTAKKRKAKEMEDENESEHEDNSWEPQDC